jgi:uncharacterized iron-regulated membrane protein
MRGLRKILFQFQIWIGLGLGLLLVALGLSGSVLVFRSGSLPAVFVFTGVAMWLKKRRSRVAINLPLAVEPAE